MISLFRYIEKEFSIKKDLDFFNDNWRRSALNKTQKKELEGIDYNINDAIKYSITPEPDIIRRKIKAAENKRRQDALIAETTEAIRRRLKDIDERSKTQPAGWMDDVTRLYLYSIYDGIGILDDSVIAPIIEQFYSHLRDHLQCDTLPYRSVSIIVNYAGCCGSHSPETEYIKLVSSIADTLSHKELSFDDTFDLMDRCISAWGYFSHMEDDGLIATKEEQALGYAVFDLWVEISYTLNLLQCSVSFAKYRFDANKDLNDLVHSCYYVFAEAADPWDTNLIKECGIAESICLKQCEEFKTALNRNDAMDCFAIGVVDMMRAFISRDISLVPKGIIAHDIMSFGLSMLNDDEKKHFNRMYQTLKFEMNWQRFLRLKNRGNDRFITQRYHSFVKLIRHLFESLIDWEIELADDSPQQKNLLLELQDYKKKLSGETGTSTINGQKILLKYSLIVLRNKIYPLGLHEGGTVQGCSEELERGLEDAYKANMSDDDIQTLLMLLSMIALRNTEYPVEILDEEPYGISLYDDKMKEDCLEFFSVSEQFVTKMKNGHAKRLLQKIIRDKAFYGFFPL